MAPPPPLVCMRRFRLSRWHRSCRGNGVCVASQSLYQILTSPRLILMFIGRFGVTIPHRSASLVDPPYASWVRLTLIKPVEGCVRGRRWRRSGRRRRRCGDLRRRCGCGRRWRLRGASGELRGVDRSTTRRFIPSSYREFALDQRISRTMLCPRAKHTRGGRPVSAKAMTDEPLPAVQPLQVVWRYGLSS